MDQHTWLDVGFYLSMWSIFWAFGFSTGISVRSRIYNRKLAKITQERNDDTRILSECLDTLAARDRTITDLRAALETAEVKSGEYLNAITVMGKELQEAEDVLATADDHIVELERASLINDAAIRDLRDALETAEALSIRACAERGIARGGREIAERERDEALQRIGDVMTDSDVTLAALEKERDALRDELAHAVGFRGAGGRAVSLAVWREQRAASQAVGPAWSDRL